MRCYQTNEGRLIPTGKAFSHNSISYPANWLNVVSDEDIAAAGLTVYTPPPMEVVRAPLESEKTNKVSETKHTANAMLAQSDWMVIAASERDRVIDEGWATYRVDIIAECTRLKGQYTTATSYEALDAIVPNWPIDPDTQARMDAEEARRIEETAKREEAKAKREEAKDA